MLPRRIECVPNFSEGRRRDVIDEIARAYDSVSGADLVHLTSDADANRSVATLIGGPDAILEAAFRGAAVIVDKVDMRTHAGVHPRQGALDVCPLVPLVNVTLEDCVRWSHELAERFATELGLPVYLYQASASHPQRRDLGVVRQGGYEGLPQKLLNPAWTPDYGPITFRPRMGITTVGARHPMVAWNVALHTSDARLAKQIAFRLREKGRHQRDGAGKIRRDSNGKPLFHKGLFQGLMATGWWLENRRECQVTMNLLDVHRSNLGAVFAALEELADTLGVEVGQTEIIGLLPKQALLDAADFFYPSSRIDEAQKLSNACDRLQLRPPEFVLKERLIESFLEEGLRINVLDQHKRVSKGSTWKKEY